MRASDDARRCLLGIADAFLAQLCATGPLAQDSFATVLNEDYVQRLAFVRAYFELLQRAADLRLDDGEIPFVYVTRDWPAGAEPAGFSTSAGPVRPTHVFDSLIAMWHARQEGSPITHLPAQRLVRSAVWLAVQQNSKTALRTLFALYANGYILAVQDLFEAIDILCVAYRAIDDDTKLSEFFFSPAVPATAAAWTTAPFRLDFDPEAPPRRPLPAAITEVLISIGLDAIERSRAAETYDDWFVQQSVVRATLTTIKSVLRRHGSVTVTMTSVLDHFEEIRADAGATGLAHRASSHSPFRSLIRDAVAVVSATLRRQAGQQWKERLLNDRAVIPNTIAQQLLDDTALPDQWEFLSAKLAPVFAHVVLDQCGFALIPAERISAADVLRSSSASRVFDSAGISDRETRKVIVRECAGEWDLLRVRRLSRFAGEILDPDTKREMTDDEQELETVNEWLQENREAIRSIVDRIRLEINIERLETIIQRVAGRPAAETITTWTAFLRNYRWCDLGHAELAIALDREGRYEEALSHLITAITLNPGSFVYWRSLGVVLQHLSLPREAAIALAVEAMIGATSKTR